MTKVQIDPGPCNFNSEVTATLNDEELVNVKVSSGCKAVMDMMAELGDEFDPYETALVKPGEGVIFEYASQNFPLHAACPVIAGILKCIEVEAGLALKHDVKITFED